MPSAVLMCCVAAAFLVPPPQQQRRTLRLQVGDGDGGGGSLMLQIGAAELNEAAANLFTMIRYLDKNDSKNIMVAPIPNDGIGIAINDRLERAAQ